MVRRRGSKVICNISPSDKTCKPLLELVPELLDEGGEVLKDRGAELEEKYVHEIYEKMAEHFSHTRGIAWPKVREFLSSFGPGSLLLDVGCGNGRFMDCVKESRALFLGTDRCRSLLDSAKTRNNSLEVFIDDCIKLNLRSNSFDGIVCIAVLHHLSTPERRYTAVSELVRCLRKGGTLLIYVWAFEQQKGTVGARSFSSKDTMVPWHFQKKYLKRTDSGEIGGSESGDKAQQRDLGVEERQVENGNGDKESRDKGLGVKKVSPDKYLMTLQRYYHLFEESEVIEMCEMGIKMYQEGAWISDKGASECECRASIVETYFDCNNWAVKIAKY
ncbi:hypothetical protein FG386_003376 [Cryptosporidium ryanae]|uniref:uncharacterized protein n=1 Tax=Cryptosporidium ryanae TaxID=515981 RepID=UPI00351A4A20|nr:hypothetical protein FG386_003376 [Cryptosporidium ryanae]